MSGPAYSPPLPTDRRLTDMKSLLQTQKIRLNIAGYTAIEKLLACGQGSNAGGQDNNAGGQGQ